MLLLLWEIGIVGDPSIAQILCDLLYIAPNLFDGFWP